MKKILLSALAAMVVQCVVAQNFEYGGLNYTVTDTKEWTVTLTGPVDKSITTLDVPAKVPYTRETADKGTETIFCTVTEIGSWAFYECSSLTNISMAETITKIGSRAFQGCTALENLSLSDNITSIGDFGFENCSTLQTITMPENLKTLGNSVLSYCATLRKVTLNEGLESIGANAFSNNNAMLEITFPSTLKSIGGAACYRCNVLRKVKFNGAVEYIGFRAFDYSFEIKEVYGKDVESWCRMGFYDSTANPLITSHKLFLGGEPVTDIVVPGAIEEIGQYTFMGLQNLKTLKIADGVKRIGREAFHGTKSLESVEFGNTVEQIGYYAFSSSAIKELNLPNSVKIIDGSAFGSCKSLEKVNWSPGIETVGAGAFSSCDVLKSVNISDLSAWCRVKFENEANPLNYAHKLELNGKDIADLVIPNDITEILDNTFEGGGGFKSITISDNVKSIGYHSFWGCGSTEELTIGTGLKQLDLYKFGCSYEIKKLHIADGDEHLTILSDDGWANGWAIPKKINDLYIGRNYTVSGTLAPNVQLLTFGPKVTNAEANDYTKYNSLLMITDLSATPPALYEFTEEQYAKVAVKVPEGATDAYKAADYWKNFALITESSDYDVENIKISFNADSYNIFPKAFQASDLAYTITPEVFQPLGVEYTSSDPSILTFDGLTPQPVGYGNVTLTARIPMTGATATAEATVYVAPTAVSLTCGETLTMKVGDTYQFVAETEPGPVVPEMLTWKSYYTSRLTIDKNGLATALKTGKNISVQVKTFNGKTYKTTVNIVEASGIDDVEAIDADSVCDVYNLNGILLRKDASASDRDALPRGIYFLRRGDKTIKFIK